MYKRNDPVMKTLGLCVKEKSLHHKTLPCHDFNMAGYLQYLPVRVCCTIIRLRYRTVYLLSLRVFICMYICIERLRCGVTVWLSGFGK